MVKKRKDSALNRSLEVIKLMESLSISSEDSIKQITDLERLTVALIFNFVRDFVWGVLSFTQIDFTFRPTTNLYMQMTVDLVYTIPFFSIVLIILKLYYYRQPFAIFNEVMLPPAFAAWIAIATWDLAQIWTIMLCKSTFEIDDESSGFIAAIATGFAEGPTQYLGALALSWTLNDPGARFNKCDFLTSVFPGLIPGTVWQLVYNAFIFHVDCNQPGYIILGSLSIAGAVGSANLGYGLAAVKISKLYRGHTRPGEHIRARLFSSSFMDPVIRTQSFMIQHPNYQLDLEDIDEDMEAEERGKSSVSQTSE